MKIIVTDLTNMSVGNHCVAGYDPETMQMVRPKPNGRNWTADQIEYFGIEIGRVLEFGKTRHQAESYLPHRNEDWVVFPNDIKAGKIVSPKPKAKNTIQDCFGDNVIVGSGYKGYFKAYVNDGVNCLSLAGLNQNPENIYLFFSDYQGKRRLRVKFIDDDDQGWDLGVTSTEIINNIRDDQTRLNVFNKELKSKPELHLRVGLARRFPAQKNRCFLQLNGIIL